MILNLKLKRKSIPDIYIRIINDEIKNKYESILNSPYFEIGIVYNQRAVYMNAHKIYVFYVIEENPNQNENDEENDNILSYWCIGHKFKDKESSIFCIKSNALRPDLIDNDDEDNEDNGDNKIAIFNSSNII